MDIYIEVADGHHVTAKKKGQVQIKICDNNGNQFIATLHNTLLAPDLCNRLFSIIMLIHLRHTFLFCKEFCTVYFDDKEKNAVPLLHSTQRKHAFLRDIKQLPKSKKIALRKKVALELLRNRLVDRSNRSLIAGDTTNAWKDVELIIYPYPFSHHVIFLQ